jgi:hypothetical protein
VSEPLFLTDMLLAFAVMVAAALIAAVTVGGRAAGAAPRPDVLSVFRPSDRTAKYRPAASLMTATLDGCDGSSLR